MYKEFEPCKLMKFGEGNIITGRDQEIEKILLTLCKKNKRGVVLVGPAGAGKTAVVNAINARLIERTVPRQLIGSQIYNVDIPFIFTKYKEDPIGVIVKILETASMYDKAILFIDEVHQLLGHKMNDLLKPYLTEKIRFIGSTTTDEYHTIINDDLALERRFTVVRIDEPNVDKTIAMIKGTKSTFEEHHKCTIPDSLCEYLVINASRFIGNRRNPDKSLDLLDIACAIMYEHEILESYDRQVLTGEPFSDLGRKKRELESWTTVSGNRILNQHYVDLAIASVTGVPYEDIKNSLDYSAVVASLQSKIYNQNEQIKTVANMVNLFKHANYDRERPISVLLFVGGAGVGKKTLAKGLATSLYGSDTHFINFDLSGLKEGFMLTELKGSPPGYIGYGKSGGLIKDVKNNPQSVVFFRGIDKAHESIIQYILDACRQGHMKDSSDREAPLNNAIIIYSVTLSKEECDRLQAKKKTMGFSADVKDKVADTTENLKNLINKDIVESVDEIIIFNDLDQEALGKIYNDNLQSTLKAYRDVDIDLKKLKQDVLTDSKNGHDVISKLTSNIPKMVFKALQGGKDE
jgi:ATP-dependent Clp protease ATP-binding subunit ClpC